MTTPSTPRSRRPTRVARAHGPAVSLRTAALTIEQVVDVARNGASVHVAPSATDAMRRARTVVESFIRSGEAYYGINTGFGSLAKRRIADADLRTLQRNLIRSHSAGTGTPLDPDVVRAVMVLLAASLCRGLSGVRPVVAETLAAMLNENIVPEVPSLGSVGASGDLAPLAHIALCLIGEGTVLRAGRRVPAARALKDAGIAPVELAAKEGLALINGTHLMLAQACLIRADAANLLAAAKVALAMTIDACRASHSFLDARLAAARNHADQTAVLGTLRSLLAGSTIVTSHVDNDPRVQDPYSLRAGPTILGAVASAIESFARPVIDELAAVTDNPLVFPRGVMGSRADAIVSGANFHGMPLAIPLDCVAIPLAHIAGASERRSYLMTGAFEPESRLKPFLAPQPGLQSGLMIAQYTAAACVNEIVGLCTPASVANVGTCAGMEDYNSFGPRSAAKARRILELSRTVVAIELLIASQGVQTHRPLRSGAGVEAALASIRKLVPPLTDDRPLSADIAAIDGLIAAGAFAMGAPTTKGRR
jgi:histidine ammonia-lyase